MWQLSPIVLIVLIVVLLSAAARRVTAEPISFYSVRPLDGGEMVLLSRNWVDYAPDGPAPENATETTWAGGAGAMVGITDWLTAGVAASALHRRARLSLPTGAVRRTTRGLGDTVLTAVGRVPVAGSLSAAPIAAAELPTGRDDDEDAFGRLPPRLQASTGSVAAAAGTLVTWLAPFADVDAAVLALRRWATDDFDPGDELRTELSIARCVLPSRRCRASAYRLVPVLESRHSWQQADSGSLAPAESGGSTWSVIPGAQVVAGRHRIDAALELPIVQPDDRHTATVFRVQYWLRFRAF